MFLDFIRQHYPQLEASYEARYDAEAFVGKPYADRIRQLVRAVTRKHGLVERSYDAILTRDVGTPATGKPPAQASLWPELPGNASAHARQLPNNACAAG